MKIIIMKVHVRLPEIERSSEAPRFRPQMPTRQTPGQLRRLPDSRKLHQAARRAQRGGAADALGAGIDGSERGPCSVACR